MKADFQKNLFGDIVGGLTAGAVALPLALAFGLSSGLPPETAAIAGLYGAIACGIFASIFGGTPSQISGPTGPMTVQSSVIIVAGTNTSGQMDLSFIFGTFVLCGVFQIILGLLKTGVFLEHIPKSVVAGFMNGIGIIIILLQLFPTLGLDSLKSPLAVLKSILSWFQTGSNLPEINGQAVLVTVIAVIVVVVFRKKVEKVKAGQLVTLVVVSLLTYLAGWVVPLIGHMPSGIPTIVDFIPDNTERLAAMCGYALVLALLGAVDSLLTSKVADRITGTQHRSNRELIGQGIGNIVAGMIGGLPGAGATMRTVVNVNSGGRTQLAGVIHGALLLAVLLGLGALAEQIPQAVLAGILFTVGYDILDKESFKFRKNPPIENFVMVFVGLLTVFWNLLFAVFIGTAIYHLWQKIRARSPSVNL